MEKQLISDAVPIMTLMAPENKHWFNEFLKFNKLTDVDFRFINR